MSFREKVLSIDPMAAMKRVIGSRHCPEFSAGHKAAIADAAEIALEADAEIERLAEALADARRNSDE